VNIKKLSLVGLLSLLSFVLFSGFAYAAVDPALPSGTNLPDLTIQEILVNIINYGAIIVVVIAVLVIVIAGIMWTTAGGNEDQQGTARKLLISGVIGAIIGLGAYAIVNTLLKAIFPNTF